MITISIYVIASFGLTYGLGYSGLSYPFRELISPSQRRVGLLRTKFVELLECPACLGFWIGVLTYIFDWPLRHFPPSVCLMFDPPIQGAIMLGLFTAGANFVLGRVTGLIKET